MRDIVETLNDWSSNSHPIAIATVISTWGSSPRKVGSKMAVRADGEMVGSVSGGCVEGAVVETALKVIEGGQPQLLNFGVNDETAWEVGLACGGSIEVFVQVLDSDILTRAANKIQQNQTSTLITCIEGASDNIGEQVLVDSDGAQIAGNAELLDILLSVEAGQDIAAQGSRRLAIKKAPARTLFLDVISAPKKLVLVGGVHISIALSTIAKQLGYQTIVVDPRRHFASNERFPSVDQLIRAWPQDAFEKTDIDENTAIAVLTHDPKIDDPAILRALEAPVFYIGVLGSQTTHMERLARLKEAGCTDTQLERLHAPIGLDIGAQSPEEIALSIMAEITAVHHA